MEFVHLHVHSHYSLLDGLTKIDELVGRAKDYNMKSLALTDHGVLYGAVEFYQKCKKADIKPIIGVETYVAPNGRENKRAKIDEKPYHLVLLAKNNVGYKNLLKLVTAAHLEGFYYKPRVDWEILKEHGEGLIASTACLQGELPQAILSDNDKKARETIEKLIDTFGKENVYLEIQYHINIPGQDKVNQKIKEYATEYDLPMIATADCHYLFPEDAEPQDVLLCMQSKVKQTDKDRGLCMMDEDYSFSSIEKGFEYFEDFPGVLENTLELALKCNVELELGETHLPYFEVPKGKTDQEYLRDLCYQGLEPRYGIKKSPADMKLSYEEAIEMMNKAESGSEEEIVARLEYELAVIRKTGFASYFLIVQDFVNWAKNQGIVVGPGRGSAAGSIVSYLINITNVDPIKYDLLFERFLNPARISMPDIDLDFADTRRDEVIHYVEEKYGKDHVAQIITFGTMAARAAVRDVGRVLGLSYGYCDRIAKLIPMFTSLDDALDTVPELKEIYKSEEDAKKLLDTAKRLEGVARHASTHACGVLITKEPLTEYVPLQYASSGDKSIVSQYSLHPVEDLGLLKMDFLGLKNLTILQNTIEILKKGRGIEINLNKIPLEDKKTFELLRRGETTGVFQLESAGMKRYLKQLRPTNIEDIIAMVALYRPGPMEWIPDYIAGKQGKKKPKYLHPKLKPILEKTFGVAIYQEQVMQIARDMAGFSLGDADVLRKAVGKKIASLLQEQKKKFIQGCKDNDVPEATAKKVFEFIEPFAGYGFNRAHAACYAMIAHQTAYMKANYPTEFMASLLTAEQNDTDRISILVEECGQMGIEVLPPDINESLKQFTAVMDSEEPRIRFGLLAIKNVGSNVVQTIIDERKTAGPYKNLEDFLSRVKTKDLNKKSLESLIKCGALDKFGERGQMLSNLEKLLLFVKERNQESLNGQSNLFGLAPALDVSPKLNLEPTEPAEEKQKLGWEKELLGLYVTEHPFRYFQEYLNDIITPFSYLNEKLANQYINAAGIISNIKRIITKKGESMYFVRLEDTQGSTEVLVFPRTLQETAHIWQEDKMVITNGRVSDKDGEIKIIAGKSMLITPENKEQIKREFAAGAKKVDPPSVSSKNFFNKKKSIYISLPAKMDSKALKQIKEICDLNKGKFKVYLKVQNNGSQKNIETNFLIDFNEQIKSKLEEVIGPGAVEVRLV